jgi:hypothetical protein
LIVTLQTSLAKWHAPALTARQYRKLAGKAVPPLEIATVQTLPQTLMRFMRA